MVDLHIHCNCSHDSKESIENICLCAIQKGLSAVAISDHGDIGPCYAPGTYENFLRRRNEIAAARLRFQGRLSVLEGIELAEYFYDIPMAEKLLAISAYDVILGSVHYVPFKGTRLAYSALDFSAMSCEEIHSFLKMYFDKLKELILRNDIDVLCHLTCPLRYINGKYHRDISIDAHREDIEEIFSLLISKGIALEVNTSGSLAHVLDTMPSRDLLALYRKMGGDAITLGSDAHAAERIAIGFDEAKAVLKELGFSKYLVFEKRKAKALLL